MENLKDLFNKLVSVPMFQKAAAGEALMLALIAKIEEQDKRIKSLEYGE